MNKVSISSFFTFSDYTNPEKVEDIFRSNHRKWHSKYEHWTMQSTSKRLEGDYWNLLVPVHFISIVIILFLIVSWMPEPWPFWQTAVGFGVFSIILFVILKSLLYKPRYELHFLPNLNNAVQHLSGEAKEAISKAKSGQYKTFTLLLIQCVFQKLSGCSKLSEGNIQRELLCKQYGISNDTLDAPLKNLLSKSYKEQHPKMQTQILDYFEEAKVYFDSLDCKPAVSLLEEMYVPIQLCTTIPVEKCTTYQGVNVVSFCLIMLGYLCLQKPANKKTMGDSPLLFFLFLVLFFFAFPGIYF